ncbi:exopolysaccharide production protein ExoY [Rhizobium leguminosarum]|uniref:Undecaprenyl-phosphate galactose phosphotransferase n=3 Tax=Rhizobium leguminosarum TaxID=384 RepID=A0ABF7QR63_RHILW|nr:sugar transferase [Rhizobium leguminosarum]ACI56399.1 Undecaprenyl-phosphate galactose phosphotransferase [Rhizobium leguminosarum bv. trifolii WSM2304]EJB05728.1 glycosyl transferase possibly involved in lipopolysaccharide synthesis [Rhizobium leguminosarum bv. trifolii WSM597]NYJ12109.1 exopolysaccharide production protein ExoY [Rhizobium leguminosarum]
MAWDAHSFEAWSRVGRPAKDGDLHASRPRAAGRSVKRALDLLLAITALILLSPLLLLVAMIVKFSDRGPVFYSHTRIGFGGAPFGCLKFRTMKTDASAQLAELLQNSAAARSEWEATRKLKDDPRITAVGDILRRSSLDELPQLFNVLRGEMSLVGPRPITAEELPRYGEHIWAYMAVRPGLTGHWQTSGRNDVSYEHRVSLDVHYFNNWSLGRDLIIIAKTIPALFSQRGSY